MADAHIYDEGSSCEVTPAEVHKKRRAVFTLQNDTKRSVRVTFDPADVIPPEADIPHGTHAGNPRRFRISPDAKVGTAIAIRPDCRPRRTDPKIIID